MTEAPPVPTTTAPPASSPAPEPQFADFDKAFPDDGLDSPEPAPAPKTETPKPSPAEAPKQSDKPVPEKPTPDKPADKPADEPEGVEGDEYNPPQVAKPSELRGWALRMGKKAKQANEQLTQLQQRLRVLESQPPRQAEQTGNLAAELAEAKKRLEAYESDLRLSKYERSQEYKDKYQAPYQQAVQRAYREVKELLVSEPNPEDPDNPRERAATQADFDEIYALPLGQASKLARAKFGDAAAIVMQHRQQIRQAAEAAFNAVEEYKGKAAQYETETKAQAAAREAGMLKMFTMATEGHSKRNPEVFLPRDGDNEGNELLEKGKGFASMVFGGNDGLSPQQIAMRDGRAFNWLTAFPRLMRDVKTLRAQIAEANQTIEQLRGSGPGKPKTAAEPAPKTAGSWEEEFDAKVPR